MSSQSSANSSYRQTGRDHAVQTRVEQGKWLSLQEATEVTGFSEKTLRRYIKKGSLKAKRLGKQLNSPFQVWIIPDSLKSVVEEHIEVEGITDIFETEQVELEEEESTPVAQSEQLASDDRAIVFPGFGRELEHVIRTVTQEFAEKLDEQRSVIFELRNELQSKERELRLLPDLQKQLEEREKMADFEKKALEKQVEELKRELESLKKLPWWKKWFRHYKD